MKDGFVKVAAASPVIRVADADYNADKVIECINKAYEQGVKVIVFPELTLTGCTLFDLVTHRTVLNGAKKALDKVVKATEGMDILAFVGLPYIIEGNVCSVAAAVYNGEFMGFVPRTEVSGTPFARAKWQREHPSIYTHNALEELAVAPELGTDAEGFDSVAETAVRNGATVIASMASFPETVTSRQDAELDIKYRSKHYKCGIIMAAPGKGESTTDNVYSGLCIIAENGVILAEDEGEDCMVITELDVDYLMNLRRNKKKFVASNDEISYLYTNTWGMDTLDETTLTRKFSMYPHLPDREEDTPAYCRRMLDIQVSGLVKRMEYAHLDRCVVGISGGVDSTLCVMVCAMAMKKMGLPASNVVACTLPCFGTSSRTKSNAIIVAEQLGCEVRVIDIGKSVYQHFDDIGHAHDDYSIAFENAQARERTQVLMDIANKVNGLDVGTEDLSEFIDGWCTYNGDHTAMYDVNMGLTKTQVRTNVRYIASTTEDKVLAAALWDVLDCPVTPELLPIQNDEIEQKSEDSVGSYSLQDFFTHKMLICGFGPAKTLRLANIAYHREFTYEELVRWLTSYCKRLFSQQFKRSCLMDGPAVEAFTVSPRTGFLMPSDGEAAMFLKELEELNQ